MTLYSPSFTAKPKKAVKTLYNSPRLWGKRSSWSGCRPSGPARQVVVVAHSPTPSTVRTAARGKGLQWKALLAWLA